MEAISFRRRHPSWRHALLFACVASALIPLADEAAARPRSWGYYYDDGYGGYPDAPRWQEPRHRSDHKNSRRRSIPESRPAQEKSQPPVEAAQPSVPMFFVVSIGGQHVSVYSNDGLFARAPISTGMPGHPTPMGIFNILGKERLHHSNIYSGAPMPFMQRITWSGVAMHEGVLPGYPASHGCIRLSHDFAKRMYGLTQGNERVIITRQDIAPAPFAHAKLPEPALLPEPQPQTMNASASILQNAVAISEGEAQKVSVKADEGDASQPRAPKLLNPADYAKAMKALAARKVEEAAAAVSPARIAVQAKAKEMQIAAVALKKAQIALNNARSRLEAADRLLQKAFGAGQASAAAARDDADAKVKEAEERVEAARRVKAAKENEWSALLSSYKELENVQKAAAEGAKIWSRRLAPLSVFISRKTQRLYVRQNFIKVFDVPVTIRNPEKPLGTHLYMAMPAKPNAAGAQKLRWLVLTVPEASADADPPKKRRGRFDEDGPRTSTAPAAAALDRIEIPPEVAGKISEMLWAGGSLIVSDSGISHETDDYSDFVILTR